MSLENTAESLEDEEFVDELKPDTKLMHGQYTIEGFLAAGGFGITYLAKDSLNRRVVIKECFPGSLCRRQNHSVMPRSRAHQAEVKSIVRLFSQEAMSLAKANHPNIVGVHQVFEENNTAYMAIDFVDGRDLLEILEDDPESLKPELVEGYLLKILDAIGHVHEMGMLHRDISPDNIIISESGEPILIDFGAARESSNEKVTRMLSALRVVKDGYSPQEFYIAGSEQPPSCDLYSLAASFYHIIAGELPPDSQWRLSARAAGDPDPYVSIGEKTDAYSKNFVTALDKAMSILPRERMQTAGEWIAHMTNTAPVVSKVTPTRVEPVVAAEAKKTNMVPILLGSTALVAAVGAGVFFMSSSDSETETVATVQSATTAETETVAAAPSRVEEEPVVAAPQAVEETQEVASAPVVETAEAQPETPVVSSSEGNETIATRESSGLSAQPETPEVSIATATPVEEPAEVENLAAVSVNEDIVPEIANEIPVAPVVTGTATDITEPEAPTIADTQASAVPPIVLALPEVVPAPQPRPLRDLEVATSALQDAQPVIRTVAPPAIEEEQPQVAEAPAPAPVEAEEPVVVETVEAAPAEPLDPSVQFFVSMAKSQPKLASKGTSNTAAAAATGLAESSSRTAGATDDAISPLITRFAPAIPFALSESRPGVITAISVDAPSWLSGDMRIVSINGQAVESNDDIEARITEAASEANSGTFEVSLGIDAGVNGAIFERALTMSNEKQTLLLNGLRFVTRENNSVWTTKVLEAPANSNFQRGDTIVSYVSTWESLDGPNSLETIIERELAKGTSSFSFAVSRDGEIWVEAFSLAAIAN